MCWWCKGLLTNTMNHTHTHAYTHMHARSGVCKVSNISNVDVSVRV